MKKISKSLGAALGAIVGAGIIAVSSSAIAQQALTVVDGRGKYVGTVINEGGKVGFKLNNSIVSLWVDKDGFYVQREKSEYLYNQPNCGGDAYLPGGSILFVNAFFTSTSTPPNGHSPNGVLHYRSNQIETILVQSHWEIDRCRDFATTDAEPYTTPAGKVVDYPVVGFRAPFRIK